MTNVSHYRDFEKALDTYWKQLPVGWEIVEYTYSCCCGSSVERALVPSHYVALVSELSFDLGDDDNGHEGWFDPDGGDIIMASSWIRDNGTILLYAKVDSSIEVESYTYSDNNSVIQTFPEGELDALRVFVAKEKERIEKTPAPVQEEEVPFVPSPLKPAKKPSGNGNGKNAPAPKKEKKQVSPKPKASPRSKSIAPPVPTPSPAPASKRVVSSGERKVIYQSSTLIVYAE